LNNILVLGDGLLGSEIVRQTGWDYISRKKNNLIAEDRTTWLPHLVAYKTIFNCIGYTKTYDKNGTASRNINYRFVTQLSDFCRDNGKTLLHVSTDFVYAHSAHPSKETDVPCPCYNWYGYYKNLADGYIQNSMDEHQYLIFRCSFKPNPFPYPKALTNLVCNTDYVNVIAELMHHLIVAGARGIMNIGTEEKTIYDLAKQTRPDVETVSMMIDETMPTNTTMDLRKMHNVLY
jgi:dTDP-4-dehydrorhamnose reductase